MSRPTSKPSARGIPASGNTLRAGVAKADITTAAKSIVVRDPLYAKVLVLDDGQTRVAIIAMDGDEMGQ